jgi:hypothetical protein
MRLAERGTCGGEDKYRQGFDCETGKKVVRLNNLRDSNGIILKWILKKEVGKVWTAVTD